MGSDWLLIQTGMDIKTVKRAHFKA